MAGWRKEMQFGFAGDFARGTDGIVVSRASATEILFGQAVMLNPDNTVSAFNETGTAEVFLGFAKRIVKQQQSFGETHGRYRAQEIAAIATRGTLVLPFKGVGTPAAGSAVYIRIAEDDAAPDAQVGDIEAQEDGANTVPLPNAVFTTGIVSDGLAEITLTQRRI